MPSKIIDIEQFLKAQRGSLLYWPKKLLARAVAAYIHEAELNELLAANRDKTGPEWARGILDSLKITVVTIGEENLAASGRYVLAGNHPLGSLDGLAVIAVAGKYHPSIRSLSHNLLRIIPNTEALIIPVNTKASSSREAVTALDALYFSEEQVLIFPAGVVSRKKNGVILDLPWQKTFLTKAVAFRREIIPIYVSARNSEGFYRFRLPRRLIQDLTGLRLEIFSLVRESLKQRNQTIRLTIGRPISWQVFDKSRSMLTWAQLVKEYVYYLENHPEVDFTDFIKSGTTS